MANTAKLAILRAKVEGVVTDLMLKTNAEHVYVDANTTLATKLATFAAQADLEALQNKVDTGDKNVSVYVADAIAALQIGDYAKAADLTALAGRVETAEGKITTLEESFDGLGDMAAKDVVSESDLDAALAEKVNAASEGNHSHANKTLLDTYTQTEEDLASAVALKHNHANKTVLDGITAENVSSWNGKAKVYAADATVDLADNEIYIQLV